MRRRQPESPAPEKLRRYVRADWEGQGCHPECAFWVAVFAFLDEHPDTDLDVDGPDVPFHQELI